MATISYAGYDVNVEDAALDAFGAASGIATDGVLGVLRRGMRVVLSNEAMSVANSGVTKAVREAGGAALKGADLTKAITAWREANEDAYESLLDKARAALWAKVVDGSLGLGRDGDGMTAEERLRHDVAEAYMMQLYAELNVRLKKEGKPEAAAFTSVPAYKAYLELNMRGDGSDEALAANKAHFALMFEPGKKGTMVATDACNEYLAGQRHGKVQSFIANMMDAEHKQHRYLKTFERKIAEAKAAKEAKKDAVKTPTIASDTADDI